ncbi:MAG: ribonuclease III [Clostridia bacterium]|nr:ribonuclease III [Clostridia bacterium]
MIDFERSEELKRLQKKIGYDFTDVSLLNTALTHTSFVKGDGNNNEHNERLEYLGDAVLELSVSAYLFENYPKLNEGKMTRVRAQTVCESSLFEVAKYYGVGEAVLLSKGESNSGGRKKPSILSDALEAVIGAIYKDGGFEKADAFIMQFAPSYIEKAVNGSTDKDYKTTLQELVQREHMGALKYVLVSEKGPDHKKEFEMLITIAGKEYASGKGHSKQEAGQNAAKSVLELLKQQ